MIKIYINTTKRPKNVKELLHIFYRSDFPDPYGNQYALATYYDKECKIQQCRLGAYRSFDDIYLLCRTYFPNVTAKKVFYELLNLNIPNKVGKFVIRLAYCPTMNRVRVIVTRNSRQTYNEISQKGKGESKYSWKELLSLLGINSQNDLDNYRNKFKI